MDVQYIHRTVPIDLDEIVSATATEEKDSANHPIFVVMCANRAELWALMRGERFVCDVDSEALSELAVMLAEPGAWVLGTTTTVFAPGADPHRRTRDRTDSETDRRRTVA